MKHVLTANQFTRDEIDSLFQETDHLLQKGRDAFHRSLRGKAAALLFYEPSTRTRMSFELAMRYLGGITVSTEAAGMFSSAAKGETIEDTVRVLASYDVSAIVIRHPEKGSAQRAAAASPVPIINAGDGGDEHPTQALLDLFTILRTTPQQAITIAFCGDLEHSRTVRSLCRLLIQYGGPPSYRLILCSPASIRLGQDIQNELTAAHIPFSETERLEEALPLCDVFYQTRVQKERFPADESGTLAHREIQDRFRLTGENVAQMKERAVILHPLPRVGEIAPEVDHNPRAKYFPDQTRNGLFIRMALLQHLLDKR